MLRLRGNVRQILLGHKSRARTRTRLIELHDGNGGMEWVAEVMVTNHTGGLQ